MKVYPDNNILVSLEKGELDMPSIESIIGASNLDFYYSDAHLYEADTMSAFDNFSKEQLVTRRMSMIDDLTKKKYITESKNGTVRVGVFDAMSAYKKIIDYPDQSHIKEGFEKIMPFESRKLLRELLKIDVNLLNSLKLQDIVPYLNTCYDATDLGTNFTATVNDIVAQLDKDRDPTSLYDSCAVLFGYLDILGYARDNETSKSDFARMWDSRHASFAALMDIFLTKDKRTIKKAELVYHLLNIKTKIIRVF